MIDGGRLRRWSPFAALALAALLAVVVPGQSVRLVRQAFGSGPPASVLSSSPTRTSEPPGGQAVPGTTPGSLPRLGVPVRSDTGIAPQPTVGRRSFPQLPPTTMASPTGLSAIFAIVSPLVSPACGGLGTVGAALGLLKGQIPVNLQPVIVLIFTVCGLIPVPPPPAICPVDAGFAALIAELEKASGAGLSIALPGLPVGDLVNTTRAIQRAATLASGVPFPADVAAQMAVEFGCRQPAS